MPAAGVVGEAMVMLTLADFILDKFGGDSVDETRDEPGRLPSPDRRAPRSRRSAGGRARLSAQAADGEAGSGGDD